MVSDTADIRVRSGADRGEKLRLLSLSDIDKRTAAYRRTIALIEMLEADAGGHGRLSTAERALIQRAAVTAALAEHLETRWLSGGEIDPAMYCTLGNALRRLLESVGLRRVPREVNGIDAEAMQIYERELAAP